MEFELEKQLKQVFKFKVGDKVKILKKEYSSEKIYYGMIVGADDFNGEFVITLAYIESGYSTCDLKIEYLTKNSDIKLLPCNEEIDLISKKEYIVEQFDKEIEAKQKEIENIKFKKSYFIKEFGKYIGGNNE